MAGSFVKIVSSDLRSVKRFIELAMQKLLDSRFQACRFQKIRCFHFGRFRGCLEAGIAETVSVVASADSLKSNKAGSVSFSDMYHR